MPVNTFELYGTGFSNLPNNCVGILATQNTLPLANRDTTNDSFMFRLTSKSENYIKLTAERIATHDKCYLGAILTDDRQTVIWVNESRPL